MLSIWTLSLLAAVGYALYKIATFIRQALFSPLRNLPGPENAHWFYGQFKRIYQADNSVLQEQWVEEYGPTITYKGIFGMHRLYTMDTRALNHILTHSAEFQKPGITRSNLATLLGAGVLVTEGEQHRQQRRIMNPAFGPAQVRELTGIFLEKSLQLRDIWTSQLAKSSTPTRIDVLSWLGRATLDVIGLAGFNYKFDSLNDSQEPNELNQAFQTIFSPPTSFSFLAILANIIPPLRRIPTKRVRQVNQAQAVMRRIGLQLLAEKKAAVRAQLAAENKEGLVEKSEIERKDLQGRDLLTLLIKANLATDIPESQRLSDEDVLAQVPTFFVAGHETTSSAVTWCLFALTQAPEVQTKLRNELLAVETELPGMDELMALPYLDAVVRETLRVHAPVPATIRTAVEDAVIPLGEPFTDIHGKIQDHIRIGKDDGIIIPILAMNRSKKLWGEDAFEFKPERWSNLPEAVTSIPGVWGNILTFLGGPRSCIGYRFSLVEMKALLFTLVRSFEFELAVKPEDVTKKSSIVQRPLILSEPDNGTQMPLLVRLHHPA